MIVEEKKKLTGVPSVDQPWNRYYTEEALRSEPPEDTMYHFLKESNRNRMNETALIYFGKKITYRQFFENIEKAAKGFLALGVKAGDLVTVFSSNTPETVYAFFGLNVIGAIPSMEYVTVSEREAVAAVKHNESTVAVVLDVLLPKFEAVSQVESLKAIISLPVAGSMPLPLHVAAAVKAARVVKKLPKVVSYAEFIRRGAGTELKEAPFRKGTPAVIVHSGGTTGSPKGVLLSNESLVYVAWAFFQNSPDAFPKDIYIAYIPLFHAFGLGMGLMAPLGFGMQVVLTPKFDEESILKSFKKYKPNHIMASGAHMPALMNDPEIQKMDLSFFRTCGFGGSPLTKAQEEALVKFLEDHHSIAKASVGYGMSELSSAICAERNVFYGKPGSVGVLLLKSRVKVLDTDTGKELSYGEIGELCFATPGLMLRYYKNEKETEKAFFVDEEGTRWIHSGDLGFVDEDGFLFITGRIKRIYSTRATKGGTMFKIFPDYVANVINEVNEVAESAVVCVEHPDYRNIAIAYVILQPGVTPELGKAKILAHINEILPSHCIPKAIRFVNELPLTQIGKVDFRILEEDAAKLKI